MTYEGKYNASTSYTGTVMVELKLSFAQPGGEEKPSIPEQFLSML